MQIWYDLDTDGDGAVDSTSDDLSGFTAQQVRSQVKQVRISLLAHEGQYDRGYTHTVSSINVAGVPVDLTNVAFQGNGRKYRWKIYTLSVTPQDLGS